MLFRADRLYNTLLGGGADPDTRATRLLALGINAALSLNPKEIRVGSSDGLTGAELLVKPDAKDRFQPRDGLQPGTTFHADTEISQDALRLGCRYCPVPVHINGQVSSQGFVLPGHMVTTAIQDQGVTGVLCIDLRERQPDEICHILLLKNGVLITTHTIAMNPGGFFAIVHCDGLQTDFSLREVVKNEAYEDLLKTIEGARPRLIRKAMDHLGTVVYSRGWSTTDPWPIKLADIPVFDALGSFPERQVSLGFLLLRVRYRHMGDLICVFGNSFDLDDLRRRLAEEPKAHFVLTDDMADVQFLRRIFRHRFRLMQA